MPKESQSNGRDTMSEENKMVECGFDMGEGRKCHAMINSHHLARRAHMKKDHGVETVAKAEVAEVPASKPEQREQRVERMNPAIVEANLRALKIQQEQIECLRADAPNVQFGGTGDRSVLEQRTDLARKKGLITDKDHPFWIVRGTEEQAISEGREIVTDHGEAFGLNEMVLTKRPKVIADRIFSEQMNRAKHDHKRFVKQAVTEGLKSAQAITPELVKAKINKQGE